MAEKHPLCPQQLMWLQLVERRAPPHPPSLPGLRNKHLFFTKKEKRRSDRGRGCAFHMTCPGTERVFVNPAVCQLAPARRHKPLSATSPLTRHRELGWAGLGGGGASLGLHLLPTSPAAASCRVAQAELC